MDTDKIDPCSLVVKKIWVPTELSVYAFEV